MFQTRKIHFMIRSGASTPPDTRGEVNGQISQLQLLASVFLWTVLEEVRRGLRFQTRQSNSLQSLPISEGSVVNGHQ